MKGIIGQPFTFTVLFLDDINTPVTVTTPTIEVFYFDDLGAKVYLVPIGTVLPAAVPAEVGRYAYPWTIPGSLDIRNTLHAVLRGTNPATLDDLVGELDVDLFTADAGTGGNVDGLRAAFVKPGVC